MFDTISSGIDALFERMGCDRESVTKRLGNSSKVDNENILDFLLKIENQSNVLIRVFLTSQQDTIEVRLFATFFLGCHLNTVLIILILGEPECKSTGSTTSINDINRCAIGIFNERRFQTR